jgi:hypothetical protein
LHALRRATKNGTVPFSQYHDGIAFKKDRNKYECENLAALIDVILAGRHSMEELLVMLGRRFLGVQLSDEQGNWTLADTLTRRVHGTQAPLHHSFVMRLFKEADTSTKVINRISGADRRKSQPSSPPKADRAGYQYSRGGRHRGRGGGFSRNTSATTVSNSSGSSSSGSLRAASGSGSVGSGGTQAA